MATPPQRQPAAAAGRGRERAERPGQADPPLRQWRLGALRRAPARARRGAAAGVWSNSMPRLRRVVVGEHDERVRRRRAGRPASRDHVDRPAPAAHAAAARSRGPFWASSTIPATRGRPPAHRRARRPREDEQRSGDAEQAEARRRRRERAPGGLVLERDAHSLDRLRRAASHSAASRSPAEQGVRSSGASVSTTSRRTRLDPLLGADWLGRAHRPHCRASRRRSSACPRAAAGIVRLAHLMDEPEPTSEPGRSRPPRALAAHARGAARDGDRRRLVRHGAGGAAGARRAAHDAADAHRRAGRA